MQFLFIKTVLLINLRVFSSIFKIILINFFQISGWQWDSKNSSRNWPAYKLKTPVSHCFEQSEPQERRWQISDSKASICRPQHLHRILLSPVLWRPWVVWQPIGSRFAALKAVEGGITSPSSQELQVKLGEAKEGNTIVRHRARGIIPTSCNIALTSTALRRKLSADGCGGCWQSLSSDQAMLKMAAARPHESSERALLCAVTWDKRFKRKKPRELEYMKQKKKYRHNLAGKSIGSQWFLLTDQLFEQILNVSYRNLNSACVQVSWSNVCTTFPEPFNVASLATL